MNERLPKGKKTKQKPFLAGNQVHQRVELLGRFSDLNICGSRIRLAHHVKGHFENTEKMFLVR